MNQQSKNEKKIKYVKPLFEENKEMFFTKEIWIKLMGGKGCMQCSGCHGCAG